MANDAQNGLAIQKKSTRAAEQDRADVVVKRKDWHATQKSVDADLTIVGFRHELVKTKGVATFTGFDDTGNILFVSSQKEKEIS